jgi:hypothetical protein
LTIGPKGSGLGHEQTLPLEWWPRKLHLPIWRHATGNGLGLYFNS